MLPHKMAKVFVTQWTNKTIFKIPLHIDLEDDDQVEHYEVSKQILWIYLCNGEVYKVSPHSEEDDGQDDEQNIEDAADYGMDEEDYDNEDVEVTFCINLSGPPPA
jgi:hypothetical protein